MLASLAALGVEKSFEGHLEAMRDKILVRIRVYAIKAVAHPAVGSQDTVDEQTRLMTGHKAIALMPLPRFPPSSVSLPCPPSPPCFDSRGHGARYAAHGHDRRYHYAAHAPHVGGLLQSYAV